MYETVRLLREIDGKQQEHDPLAHDLKLLRVALEKHQIADDRKLKAPLKMGRHPPNNDATDHYVYSPDDPRRSHIMPTGFSARGSIMWQVIDLKANAEWPAPGFEDTELGVLLEPEGGHGETEVYERVQA